MFVLFACTLCSLAGTDAGNGEVVIQLPGLCGARALGALHVGNATDGDKAGGKAQCAGLLVAEEVWVAFGGAKEQAVRRGCGQVDGQGSHAHLGLTVWMHI